MKINGIYQIVNTITGDCYIGCSVDLNKRKREHFSEYYWKHNPNKPLYNDMKQYGKNNFLFRPIWLCEHTDLKKYEQLAIEKYNPKYNMRDACTGMSKKEYQKQYYKEHADNIKQYMKQKSKQYYKEHTDSMKQYYKEHADNIKQQNNQQCLYKNEILSFAALKSRFFRQGIEHPTLEAKKYLIGE